MECSKCRTRMDITDVSVEIAAHDERLLDIIITCPKCGMKTNEFVNTATMQEIDGECPECPACGMTDYEGSLKECPHCGNDKCSKCDMGDDVECAGCGPLPD